jgi:replicative DNA helicase
MKILLERDLTAFDRINGEFKGGEFFILAGLESMGKTVLMIEIANHWAANGKESWLFKFRRKH